MLNPADRFSARLRTVAGALALLGCLLVAACGGPTETPSAATPSPTATPSTTPTPTPSRASASPSPSQSAPESDEVVIDITITHDDVSPSGEKIDVEQGQTVVLNVTSEIDDEIHAHAGGDGFTLEVPAGEEVSGDFVASERGSFEVESHHLGKIIVILRVR